MMIEIAMHKSLETRRRKYSVLQIILLFSSALAYVPKIVLDSKLPTALRGEYAGVGKSTRHYVSSIASNFNYVASKTGSSPRNSRKDFNYTPSKSDSMPRKKRKDIEEFQWLNWVYSNWKDVSAGDLSEEVLKQMAPAISKWGKRKAINSGDRAEELLERIIVDNLAGNPHAELTVSLFNAAMDAHAKQSDPIGVQRVLRRMEILRRENDHLNHLRPDVFSMSILATAWAKSRSPDAAAKAEDILNYMELRNLTPNTITYNAVLHAMAVSNQIDKAIRAEDLVKQMKDRHASGEDCEPDTYTYLSLIQAWSRTCLPGSPQKAEQVLNFLDEESEKGNKKLSPNSYCFTATIHAWSRSSEKNRARNAYQLLNHMRKRYLQNRSKKVKPNVVAFTAVLNACALPVEESEKEDAFAIAQLTMSELLVGDMDKPNFLSFAAFLSAISSTLDPSEERDKIVEEAFKQCRDAGQVGQIVLEKLCTAASPELFCELVGSCMDKAGEFQLPASWTASIKGERNPRTPRVYSVTRPIKLSRASKLRLKAAQQFGGQSGSFTGKQFPPHETEWIQWSQKSL